MRIGIDARMMGTGEGIARYVEELIRNLMTLDQTNQYIILIDSKFSAEKFGAMPKNFRYEKVYSPYYSWLEQTRFIWELMQLRLDMVHFASFNVPIFYPGKFVVTIHDIIHHLYPGKKKKRFLHRQAYRLVFASAVNPA